MATIAPSPRPTRAARIAQLLALAGLALLPKCPLCLLALLGMWGAAEGSTWAARVADLPVLQGLGALVLALVVLALARRHGLRTALVAGAMASLLWLSKFLLASPALVGITAAALGAVVLLGRRRPAPASTGTPDPTAPHATSIPASPCGCSAAARPPLDRPIA
jgi:uncharacterized MnhB-related membrane protein